MKTRTPLWRFISAATVLVAAAAGALWWTRQAGDPSAGVSLLSDMFSERLLADARPAVAERVIDFRASADMHGLLLGGMTYTSTPAGLEIHSGSDPLIVVTGEGMQFNVVNVSMQSDAEGFIELFWSRAGEPFDEARKQRLPIVGRPVPADYQFDLTPDLDSAAGPYCTASIRSTRRIRS